VPEPTATVDEADPTFVLIVVSAPRTGPSPLALCPFDPLGESLELSGSAITSSDFAGLPAVISVRGGDVKIPLAYALTIATGSAAMIKRVARPRSNRASFAMGACSSVQDSRFVVIVNR
jgi:hypothetical protein